MDKSGPALEVRGLQAPDDGSTARLLATIARLETSNAELKADLAAAQREATDGAAKTLAAEAMQMAVHHNAQTGAEGKECVVPPPSLSKGGAVAPIRHQISPERLSWLG